MTAVANSAWRVVVPIKEHDQAKSRLRAPAGVDRSQLALAFALDTLTAVYQVVAPAAVFVVTDDEAVLSFVADHAGVSVRDPRRGLNPAIVAGLEAAAHDGLSAQPPGAVLLGDLPALNAAELTTALRACAAAESCVVPDADGTGTVLLTHHDVRQIVPRFGAGSAARHGRASTTLLLDLLRLRTDVDDESSFVAARALGVGPHTSSLLTLDASVG